MVAVLEDCVEVLKIMSELSLFRDLDVDMAITCLLYYR